METPRRTLLLRLLSCWATTVAGYAASAQAAPPRPEAVAESAVDESTLDGADGRPLSVRLFRPRSELVAPNTEPAAARFPVVDVHTHLEYKLRRGGFRSSPSGSPDDDLDAYVRQMDAQNVAVAVSLDGRWGAELADHLRFLAPHRDRFVVFANIDWQGAGDADDPATWDCLRPEFGRIAAERLREAKEAGASGLKIFKRFGLGLRDAGGELLAIDDLRWEPIWDACGELGLPVLIHTGDPAAFFRPVDRLNERWEELQRHPDWSFYGDEFPSREALLAARNRVIERHPEVTFLGAHVGGSPEDLATVAAWLDRYPNLNVEIAARVAELGRQPYAARRFFTTYSDRILFGTDGPRGDARLRRHWRFLETADEYFPYVEDDVFPPQGQWNIYGLRLPDAVLRQIYHENAARLIPGVAERLDKR